MVVWWLVALAQGEAAYQSMRKVMSHPILLILLLGWTLALFYHLLNGIRHLLWDTGMMLDLGPARTSGWVVVALSIVLTAIVWGSLI